MAAETGQADVRSTSLVAASVRDCAVLALGADEHGDHAVAVWQFAAEGKPTGAHVARQEDVFTDPDSARRVLAFLERRAITGSEPSALPDVLRRLTTAAKLDVAQWWEGHLFTPVDVFDDMRVRRSQYEQTVATVRQGGRQVAPLAWQRDYSDGAPPGDFAALHRLSRRRTPPGAPVVSEVLGVCGVLSWLVECWQETEQVKNRRTYIRDEHGGPEELPPCWREAARHAERNRLPL